MSMILRAGNLQPNEHVGAKARIYLLQIAPGLKSGVIDLTIAALSPIYYIHLCTTSTPAFKLGLQNTLLRFRL